MFFLYTMAVSNFAQATSLAPQTVGLTLAARLVAIDSNPTVLVLEAGEAHLDNTDIRTSLVITQIL